VAAGKIRCYGWSTDHVENARLFGEGRHCAAIQLQMNVIQDAAPMIALCEELNLAAINRGPLAMGLLTGKFTAGTHLATDDVRANVEMYFTDGRPNADWLSKLEAIREILSSEGRTLRRALWPGYGHAARRPCPIPRLQDRRTGGRKLRRARQKGR